MYCEKCGKPLVVQINDAEKAYQKAALNQGSDSDEDKSSQN